ncbi:MAG: polyprenyl synthetase family protein [Helicobacter sp.]|nr:polyprenyl synthetase family protein [Helicobacter sp.]
MSALEDIRDIMQGWFEDCACESAKQLGAPHSGKMLRSKLILAIAPENEQTKRLCAVIELIQNASLLHDDVIDEASMRRGQPSLNATAGARNAIMMGDLLYAKAFYELTRLGDEIARIVSEAVVHLSNGEVADVCYAGKLYDNELHYLQVVYDKTASLLRASSHAAAILAGLDTQALASYGENLGMAFQIVDDVLDIMQDSTKLGKNALHDFKEGKCTLPYIYLFQKLDSAQKQVLQSLIGRDLDAGEQQWLLDNLRDSGAIEQAIAKAREYGDFALQSIQHIQNAKLKEIVAQMIEREF